MPSKLPIFLVCGFFLARILELRTKRPTIAGNVSESTTLRVFIFCGVGMVAGAILEFTLRGQRVGWPWLVGGVVCSGLAVWLRRAAIAALGPYWSLHVEIRNEHQFVDGGPFRWVRHPTYLSMILELLGIALMLKAFIALAASLVIFIPTLVARLKLEEGALVEKFGDRYRQYQLRTPLILPFWSKLR